VAIVGVTSLLPHVTKIFEVIFPMVCFIPVCRLGFVK
jgi:hypothetical protein